MIILGIVTMSFQLWKSRSTGSAGNVAAFRGRPGRRPNRRQLAANTLLTVLLISMSSSVRSAPMLLDIRLPVPQQRKG